MVIPQTTTAWNNSLKSNSNDNNGTYISLLVRIYQLSAGDDSSTGGKLIFPRKTDKEDIQEDEYGLAAVGVAANWQAGKHYTYNIEFFGDNGGGGVTDPDVDPVDPTDPVNPEDPEVPVVGGKLTLKVTVSDWTNEEATNTPMP